MSEIGKRVRTKLLNDNDINVLKELKKYFTAKEIILFILYKLCKNGKDYFIYTELLNTLRDIYTVSTVFSCLDKLIEFELVKRRKTLAPVDGKAEIHVVYFINCENVQKIVNNVLKLLVS